MSWKKRDHFLDRKQGMHVVTLHDPETKAVHLLQVNLGHALSSCPHCGHVKEAGMDIDAFDIEKYVQEQIAELDRIHGKVKTYGERHKIPARNR